MALATKTFKISKGEGIRDVDRFLGGAVGRDLSLIKGITAVSLNDQQTQLTLTYLTHPETVVDITSPVPGLMVGSAEGDPPSGLVVQYASQFDPLSVAGGAQIQFDGTNVTDSNDWYVEPAGDNSILSIDINDKYGATLTGIHNLLLDDTILRKSDSQKQEHSILMGFTVTNTTSPFEGLQDLYTRHKKRGLAKVKYTTIDTSIKSTDKLIGEILSREKELLLFTTVKKGGNISELFMITIEETEPRIVATSPPLGANHPENTQFTELYFTFDRDLNRTQVTTENGLFAIVKTFSNTIDINASYLTLLDDDRTIKINISGVLTDNSISNQFLSIILKKGIRSAAGVATTRAFLLPFARNDLSGGGSVSELNDLSDVNITSLADNEILKYDAGTSKWVNEADAGGGASELNDLSDVTITAAATNEILLYNGSAWVDTALDHDTLPGFVANEHIDHSAVTITAGDGLAGGGTIAATRTIDLDIGSLATDTPVAADHIAFDDAGGGSDNKATITTLSTVIDHDTTTNFVANEHIDHTAVDITAGVGLAGGGDISSTRTIDLDIGSLATDTPVAADHIAFDDAGGGDDNKATITTLSTVIDHDTTTNFVANEHINHTSVTLTAGDALAGGGDISANRSFALDINGLAAQASPDSANDTVVIYDSAAGAHRKVVLDNLPGGGLDNVVEDTTPQLGGELDAQSNTIGFTEVGTEVGASPTDLEIDFRTSNKHRTTLNADSISLLVTDPSYACHITLITQQDSTGERTLHYPSSFKWCGGSTGAGSTGTGMIDIIVCYYDGSANYHCCIMHDFC